MIDINEDNFEQEVLKSDKPVVADYWAPWCGPCKMTTPVFEKLSKEITNAKFVKVNVDENPRVAQLAGVLNLPCVVIYKNGEEAERAAGFQTEQQLKAKLTSALE